MHRVINKIIRIILYSNILPALENRSRFCCEQVNQLFRYRIDINFTSRSRSRRVTSKSERRPDRAIANVVISLTENPLYCGCESQELWEWLRDHQKLVSGVGGGRSRGRNGVGVGDVEGGLLRCEQPPELRGLVFLDLHPHAFCSAPLVLKLAIQDIQPFSVLVSWQSRNHSGLHGYQVAYHALDNVDEVRILTIANQEKARNLHHVRQS